MSLFRTLSEAALIANLSKNEAKVFIALLNQTLGFGKSFDHLTYKRLAQLTGIRLDRLYEAVDGVIDAGLFEQETSSYYDYRYQIAEKFLKQSPIFFTPHLPKNGNNLPKEEDLSVPQNDPPKNGDIHNNTSTSFNPTKSIPQQTAVEYEKSPPPSSVNLPATIEPQHQATCLNALKDLSPEQQRRVIETFEIKGKHETIYNPVGLLIVLAKAEREGRLIIPKINHHPSHRAFDAVEKPIKNDENKDSSVLEDRMGKLNWLKDNALSNDQLMPDFADSMGMSIYLEDTQFVQHWLICHANETNQLVDQLAKKLGLNTVGDVHGITFLSPVHQPAQRSVSA